MRVQYPKFRNICPISSPLNVFTASKGSNICILFVITAAGVVLCGGPESYYLTQFRHVPFTLTSFVYCNIFIWLFSPGH